MLRRCLFRATVIARPPFPSSPYLRNASQSSSRHDEGSTSSSSPSLQRIFLIRHGQSQGNIDEELFSKIADHAIPLSDAGHNQAISAGHELRRYLEAEVWRGTSPPADWRCGVWASPYYRVRQTRDHVIHAVGPHLTFSREHVALSEQQFGLFAGVPWADLETMYPPEVEYYKRSAAFGGKFWAKMPLGESRFDVAMRVSQFFSNLHREAAKKKLTDLIIFAHGVSIRAFVMMWFHRSPEWFEACPNPHNAAIWLIDSSANVDRGILFPGFPLESSAPEWLRDVDPKDGNITD